MKLHAIRRTPNTLGVYAQDWHLVLSKRRRSNGPGSALGLHHRRRLANGRWRQSIIRLAERALPIPGGVGCWTFEVQRYETKTAAAAKAGNRLTIKKFVRLKFGLGGEIPPLDKTVTAKETA